LKEKNQIIRSLENRENEILSDIRSKEATAKKLESELAAIIENERRLAAAAGSASILSEAELLLSSEFSNNKGKLPWPSMQGIVTGKYGEHPHPDYVSIIVRNDGIYISTIPGSDVLAVFNGVVSRVFSIPGENYTVIIKHGEFYALYHNLMNVSVVQGQIITTNQKIGIVSTDMDSNESILYFQLWNGFERNNPEEWLNNQ